MTLHGGRPIESAWRPVGDVAREALAEIEVLNAHPDAVGLRTGIPVLDDAIRLALEPGRLIVVAGVSGGAKTVLCTQFAVAFAAQLPTFLVTLEDDPRDAVKRKLANLSRENVGAIRSGFAGTQVPDSIRDAVGALDDLDLDISDELGAPKVEELAMIVMAWRKQNPDAPHAAVIIDQLSHLRPSDPTDAFWKRFPKYPKPPRPTEPETKILEWQVNMLREMAIKNRLTVVLAHQLNDNVDESSGKPTARSIRSSRGIVHKADLVMIPWIPTMVENPFAGPGDPKSAINEHKVGIILSVKARTIAGFEVPVQLVGAQQRFIGRDESKTDKWRPVPAPTATQLAGAKALLDLKASFALAALQRCAVLPATPTAPTPLPIDTTADGDE